MFFGLSPEQQEYQHALRAFFRSASTSQDVRRLTGDERGYDQAAWRRMAGDLGVQGLGIPEQYGGSGASFIELAIALEEAGYRVLAIDHRGHGGSSRRTGAWPEDRSTRLPAR